MSERRTPETLEAHLVEAADDAIIITRLDDGSIVDANKAAQKILGFSFEELRAMAPRMFNLLPASDYERFSAQLIERGELRVANMPILHADGSTLRVDLVVKRYLVGDQAYHVNILRDVAMDGTRLQLLRKARGRFLESEAIYRGLVEFTDDPVFVCELDTLMFVEANPAAREMFGYSMGALRQLHAGQIIGAWIDGSTIAAMKRVLSRSGGATIPDILMQRSDGTTFHGYLRLNVYEAANRKLIVGIVRDVTEQLQRERQLRDASARLATSEATYRGLVACTDDAVLISDFESGLFVEANPAACALLGYSGAEWNRLRGRDIHPAKSDEVVRLINEELHGKGRAKTADILMRRKDGTTFIADLMQNVFEAAGRKLIVSIARDVTERRLQAEKLHLSYQELKHAQAKALHAQKLAAVGEVAAGVAHEVNNPAAFVSMNLDAMQSEIERMESLLGALRAHVARDEDPDRKRVLHELLETHSVDLGGMRAMLDDNREGVERIRSVTRDLRLFSRVEKTDVIKVDLNAVVTTTLNLLMNELRHRARVNVRLTPVPIIHAQRGKLAQVVTNLLLNASQAIVEGAAESNTITVATEHDGSHVNLSVQDTGMGMSEEVAARIFDPFFTTKPREEGMGLGLSLCAEIVSKHRGNISVTSEPGKGSRFLVRIPLVTGMRARAPTPPPPVSRISPLKRILVIDDDPAMLRAYRRMLADYEPVVVSSGAKALEVLRGGAHFDLILCDLMMPEMDGPQVYDAIEKFSPKLVKRMVFCTGGAFTPRAREFLARVGNQVLDKPASLDKLERILEGT